MHLRYQVHSNIHRLDICRLHTNTSSRSTCRELKLVYFPHHFLARNARTLTIKASIQSTVATTEPKQQHHLDESFSWSKQWYCIGITQDLDPLRPHAITVLNHKLVLWFSSTDGQWHCFEDRCPHRAASLSEGKVWKDGTLYCSYHGWRFNNTGTCTVIPQAANEDAETRACAAPRACATFYPTKNIQGKIFVWGESGPDAEFESDKVPLPLDDLQTEAENQGIELLQAMPLYARVLPYDYQTLVENLIDPAHVPFAHHGLAGSRDAVQYGSEETRKVDAPPGSVFKLARYAKTSKVFDRETPLYLEFKPPSLVLYYQQKPDGTFFSFPAWCTPISPGKSLLITQQTTSYTDIPTFLKILSRLPRWMDHLFLRLRVVDGDTPLLMDQERIQIQEDRKYNTKKTNDDDDTPSKTSTTAWRRLFYMPTSSDVGVVAFRTWLDGRVAKGGPFGPVHEIDEYPPLPASRKDMLDRFHSHTEKCSSCKKVFNRVEWVLRVAQTLNNALWGAVMALAFYSIAAVIRGSIISSSSVSIAAQGGIAAVLCALIFGMVVRLLRNLRDQFVFVDYRHADMP